MGLSMNHNLNFNLLEGLQKRVSHPRLIEPAPDRTALDECYQAAFRAPDHAYLRPWRFVEIFADARQLASQEIAKALKSEQSDMTDANYQKASQCLLRAPLVVLVYASAVEHAKVPRWEQEVAVGCAAYAFSTALFALGYGSVWRTGEAANSSAVAQAFGLEAHEKIVGFIYIGTPEKNDKNVPVLQKDAYVTTYPAVKPD